MTREVAHFQMFEAALETISAKLSSRHLQSDPRYSNLYFNMSTAMIFAAIGMKGKAQGSMKHSSL
jgi:Mn-containing catalase